MVPRTNLKTSSQVYSVHTQSKRKINSTRYSHSVIAAKANVCSFHRRRRLRSRFRVFKVIFVEPVIRRRWRVRGRRHLRLSAQNLSTANKFEEAIDFEFEKLQVLLKFNNFKQKVNFHFYVVNCSSDSNLILLLVK